MRPSSRSPLTAVAVLIAAASLSGTTWASDAEGNATDAEKSARAVMQLDEAAADCIRANKPWFECYNKLPNITTVEKGFKGFFDSVYEEDDRTRSFWSIWGRIPGMWVPTPAESDLLVAGEQGR